MECTARSINATKEFDETKKKNGSENVFVEIDHLHATRSSGR